MVQDKDPRPRRLTASGMVSRGPCLFYGIQITASSAGETSKVFAGPDENDMYLFDIYKNSLAYSEPFWLPDPVRFDQGLYVKLGDNVTSILVLFEDLPT